MKVLLHIPYISNPFFLCTISFLLIQKWRHITTHTSQAHGWLINNTMTVLNAYWKGSHTTGLNPGCSKREAVTLPTELHSKVSLPTGVVYIYNELWQHPAMNNHSMTYKLVWFISTTNYGDLQPRIATVLWGLCINELWWPIAPKKNFVTFKLSTTNYSILRLWLATLRLLKWCGLCLKRIVEVSSSEKPFSHPFLYNVFMFL